MSLLFQIRGTQIKPWYSAGGSLYATQRFGGGSIDAQVIPQATSGVFGGSVIDYSNINDAHVKILVYEGRKNLTSTGVFSNIIRFVPNWTGAPSTKQPLYSWGADDIYPCAHGCFIDTTGKIFVNVEGLRNNDLVFTLGSATYSFTAGVPTELMLTWAGPGASVLNVYQDGVFKEAIPTATTAFTWDNILVGELRFGYSANEPSAAFDGYLNEFLHFDDEKTAYAARTDFWATANFNADNYTDPGNGNVATGIQYYFAGTLQTGQSDEPNEADVRFGTVYDNGTKTGACHVPTAIETLADIPVDNTIGTRDDAPAAQVATGVVYAGGTLVGTRDVITVVSAEFDMTLENEILMEAEKE